ncbi:phage tail fiber protein [Serratia fonticola]|uniref:phage tail fiber protein n=1 Tax=Serratia fonticola TaxID=47917 RepID=UPI0015C6491A|nr:prophage tail fiber N-terminal domain-containing protein [Serratia fonticola]NYA15773.1 prophage tail fiber N-terminal domain-containing protein [Serratia fonticola]NYA35893.1 prophage tail fiber N-terminal domain-containing protein [Serratia fonticola]
MTVISGTLIGPYGESLSGVTIEMVAVNTTATVIQQASSRYVTDTNGRYSLKVEPGKYNVMVSSSGQQPARVGSILVEITSSTGTLNDFLTKPGEEDLTPEIVKTVDRMRAEAANSAAVAKVSENNSVAAMANALSKVVTAEQTVAGVVKFNNGYASFGEAVMQIKTAGASAITRYKDMDGVEQGAIFVTPATGKMTHRWGGTAFSVVYDADGNVTFPRDIYSGATKVATQSTSLGKLDLNTIITEGEYYQALSANATVSSNYPSGQAGVLKVFNSRAGVAGASYVTHFFYPYNADSFYYQRYYDSSKKEWSSWDIHTGRNKNDARYAQLQGVGKTFTDADDFKSWMKSQNGLTSFRLSAAIAGFSAYNPALIWNTSDTYAMLMPYYSSSEIKCVTGNASGKYQEFFLWNTGNTTVDSNGFVKKASPIVKLFGDGSSELNEQSLGVTTERIGQGVYRVSGVLGFNGDGAWGGHGNGIEIPVDDNKRALIWVESKVLPDGDIEVRTYHRTYDTGPYSARNKEAMDSGDVDQKNIPIFVEMPDGTPVDIPAGRFIDLRVEMPTVDEPELELEPEPEVPVEPTVPELNPEPGVDSEPSSAVGEEGVEQDRPVSERKPIF